MIGDSKGSGAYSALKLMSKQLNIEIGGLNLQGCWPVDYEVAGNIRKCNKWQKIRMKKALASDYDTILLVALWPEDISDALKSQIEKILPHKNVIVLGKLPHFNTNVIDMVEGGRTLKTASKSKEVKLLNGFKEQKAINDSLRGISENSGAYFISAYDELCIPKACPILDESGKNLLYVDTHHLSLYGAKALKAAMLPQMEAFLKEVKRK